MSLSDRILGRPLASNESEKQELTVWTGVPVLGLDALASTGYGPEAALTILLPLGTAGLRYFPLISLLIVAKLVTLCLSYRQTQAAYPNGGGAYLVAKDNMGLGLGLCAAVALILDYLLNVSVAIASGVGAVVSAIPSLHPYMLLLCLAVLATLLVVNLRGVRESGLTFIVPVFVFVGCMAIVLGVGAVRTWGAGGHPAPVLAPPALPRATTEASTWLLLGAFANGLTAMTGVEAVSNGVPLFRKPAVPRAQRTLTVLTVLLGTFLLGIGYLCPAYHVGAMNEQQPGYQTVLSQLVAAVFGRGAFYYVAVASIFIVLTYSAQTSFSDFPRVCRFLADDRFLPRGYAKRGRRLVFSNGIVVLTVLSAALLLAFGGVTDRLIPLFAVGAFTAFLMSQAGMVLHWIRRRGRGAWTSLPYNAIGAATTTVALAIIVAAKFEEGAWLVVIVGPALVLLLRRIRRHYERVEREIDRPLPLRGASLQPPLAIVPIEGWNRPAEKALRFAQLLSDDVIALHISTEGSNTPHLRKLWSEKVAAPASSERAPAPRLEVIPSPYRLVHEPIVEFVRRMEAEHPDRLVAVVLPEVAEPRWYEELLHNVQGAALKTLLDVKAGDRTFVVYAPWHLRDV